MLLKTCSGGLMKFTMATFTSAIHAAHGKEVPTKTPTDDLITSAVIPDFR